MTTIARVNKLKEAMQGMAALPQAAPPVVAPPEAPPTEPTDRAPVAVASASSRPM